MGIFSRKKLRPSWYDEYDKLNIPHHIKYPNGSMYDSLKEMANNNPNVIAYSYFNSLSTYRKFIEDIDICAKALLEKGIGYGDIVTICMPNTPEAIIFIYALNKIGAVANMVHPLSSVNEIIDLVNEANSKLILMIDFVWESIVSKKNKLCTNNVIVASVKESMDLITGIGYYITRGHKIGSILYDDTVINWKTFFKLGKRSNEESSYIGCKDTPAVILHSGGTTGKPKGIVLSNLNFNAIAMEEIAVCQCLHPGVTVLAVMPIFHGFGLATSLHVPFLSGATAIVLPELNPKKFANVVKKYRPNIIGGVPSLYETFINDPALNNVDLSFITCAMSGGDYLSANLKRRVDEFFRNHNCKCGVRAAFGMTECCSGVVMMPKRTDVLDGVGIPVPDVSVKIVDPNSQVEVPLLQVGEICVSAPSVMLEYLNDPKETANILQVHQDGKKWLHTGDLGYMDEFGYIYYTQRLKRMIISNGYNVYPSQIEKVIESHPSVLSCTVVGISHPKKVQVPKAFIVLRDGVRVTLKLKEEIKELCALNIAKYSLPYEYEFKKSLPKTKMGKVDYKKLEK